MSPSEYVASFFLVILGFAVSEALKGSARLIRERHLIKFYWPYLVVVPFAFEILIIVFIWLFTLVGTRAESTWSLPDIAGVCLIVVPLALISYLLFPSRIKEGFDLRKFYFDNAKIIIVIMMVQATLVLVMMIILGDWMGAGVQITLLVFSGIALARFETLHLVWLFSTMVLINVLVFFGGPVAIG